jgi:hypothetical protein
MTVLFLFVLFVLLVIAFVGFLIAMLISIPMCTLEVPTNGGR